MLADRSGTAARPLRSPAAQGGPVRGLPVAYFTMEVALGDEVPTFSGGLGVLAGDYLRSIADLGVDLVAVTLLYRHGYLRQEIDGAGDQVEVPVRWQPEDVLERLAQRTTIEVNGRPLAIAVWRLAITGVSGGRVEVLFLDTDLAENAATDRILTDRLYSGDQSHRLRQEAVLGLGGVKVLEKLGRDGIATFHMNEGHSSLLTLALIERDVPSGAAIGATDLENVRARCVFTTHTPVPAGHDRFDEALVRDVLGRERTERLREMGCLDDGELNMSWLGMRMSRVSNAVSVRHRAVARAMFPKIPISSVTNGVHAGTWAAPAFCDLFDRSVPGWRRQNDLLRYVSQVPLDEIADAHDAAKRALLDEIAKRTERKLDPAALTLGFARRVTPYKQPTLLFSDVERLISLAHTIGPIQVVCAGKAHPRDEGGKALVSDLVRAASVLRGAVEVVFLENYDLELAKVICAGADVWLNTPQKPNEASGTSGMKAALNGVPSLSVLDGWWLEGCVEGVTGWSVGDDKPLDDERAADDLYTRLEKDVSPLFYSEHPRLAAVRRDAISLNGSFFNTERMAREYISHVYGG